MKKNIMKATIYTFLGIAISIAAMLAGICMYCSGTFLPVYNGKTYVIGNQILRYELYLLLLVTIISSVRLADYGSTYLIKVIQKKVRRR